MAIIKRGNGYAIALKLDGRQVWVSARTDSRRVAERIEKQVSIACKSRDYRALDPDARAVTITLYTNQGWTIPPDLLPKDPLTLWGAVRMCLESNDNPRLKPILDRVVDHFGGAYPIADIWIPQIRAYLKKRLSQGAAASTVNKEKTAISTMFRILIEHRIVENNPALSIPQFSEEGGQREVFVSRSDVQRILDKMPPWFQAVAQCAYYTGMRRGEILGLTRDKVDLGSRIIRLWADDTKEGRRKRVPIHRDLIPILIEAMKVRALDSDILFLMNGQRITDNKASRFWKRALRKVRGLENLRFHDLRHTWRTNARRSGMREEIEHAIMGHAERNVHERYGHISDEELVSAIDDMVFNRGETVLWIQHQAGPAVGVRPSRCVSRG